MTPAWGEFIEKFPSALSRRPAEPHTLGRIEQLIVWDHDTDERALVSPTLSAEVGGSTLATRRGPGRQAHDVFWAAPESRTVWNALSPSVLETIARCDTDRLEVERSRAAPHIREKMTAPVYSVADRFASWERVVRRMELGWGGHDFYPISAYGNDLDSRDALDQVMRALPDKADEGPLGQLLARLDARFRAATLPDPERSLRPWVRPTTEGPEDELGEWWGRRPLRIPWAD